MTGKLKDEIRRAAFERAMTGPEETIANLEYKAMKLRQIRTELTAEIKRIEAEAKAREVEQQK